jgi:hypothetical protein
MPADLWLMIGLAAALLIAADLLGAWIVRVPTAASSPLELLWDAALKRSTVRRLVSHPIVLSLVAMALPLPPSSGAPRVQLTAMALILGLMCLSGLPLRLPPDPGVRGESRPLAGDRKVPR